MIHNENPKMKISLTFGRFNIGHFGHVELVQKMLDRSLFADVYVSTGKFNNNWDLRVLLLKALLRRAGVPLDRVNFLKAHSPHKAIRRSLRKVEDNSDVILVLGEDQAEMGESLSETYDVFLTLNQRTNSSTNIRFLLDNPGNEDRLRKIYKSEKYPIKLAALLRTEEKDHEKSRRSSEKTDKKSRK